MSFPEYEQLADALLCFIFQKGGTTYSLTPKQIYDPLADFFGLDESERKKPRDDGYPGLQWQNRVQWTRQLLINKGYLDGHVRGVWQLTEQGIHHASSLEISF